MEFSWPLTLAEGLRSSRAIRLVVADLGIQRWTVVVADNPPCQRLDNKSLRCH